MTKMYTVDPNKSVNPNRNKNGNRSQEYTEKRTSQNTAEQRL